MATVNKVISVENLGYYHSLAEGVFAGSIEIAGQVITLKSKKGTSLGTVTIPQTKYDLATALANGLMSSAHVVKLEGISEGATKVENSTVNGNVKIDGSETPVYAHPNSTAGALTSGIYKITTDATGHVIAGSKVVKGDITALGIPAQDTTYTLATAGKEGLMSSAHFSKLEGISAGAQVNVIEKVSVNGKPLAVSAKGVNIDLSGYATKDQVTSAVHYKGSVANFDALPLSPAEGDMYNVEAADPAHGIDSGTNVVWNGKSWDAMAPMFVIESVQNSEIDAIFK